MSNIAMNEHTDEDAKQSSTKLQDAKSPEMHVKEVGVTTLSTSWFSRLMKSIGSFMDKHLMSISILLLGAIVGYCFGSHFGHRCQDIGSQVTVVLHLPTVPPAKSSITSITVPPRTTTCGYWGCSEIKLPFPEHLYDCETFDLSLEYKKPCLYPCVPFYHDGKKTNCHPKT